MPVGNTNCLFYATLILLAGRLSRQLELGAASFVVNSTEAAAGTGKGGDPCL
jgi:hypothetical protein